MNITIHRNRCAEFERSMLSNPMVEVISVCVKDDVVKYKLDCPDFFNQFPVYMVLPDEI